MYPTFNDDLGNYRTYGKESYREYDKIGTIAYQIERPALLSTDTYFPYLYLSKIQAARPHHGNGTRLFRKVVQISWKGSDAGRIKVDAVKEQIFFYLKMGFVPERTEISIQFYSPLEIFAIKTLNKMMPPLKNGGKLPEYLHHFERRNLEHYVFNYCDKLFEEGENKEEWLLAHEASFRKIVFKKMLSNLKPELYPQPEKITDEQLESEQPFLDEVVKNPEQKVNFFQRTHVPRILRWMEGLCRGQYISFIPFTDDEFTNLSMHLSPEGIARWKDDIDGRKPFLSFRRLEHIQSLMTEEQRAKLHAIFAQIPEKNPSYFAVPG